MVYNVFLDDLLQDFECLCYFETAVKFLLHAQLLNVHLSDLLVFTQFLKRFSVSYNLSMPSLGVF